MSRVEKLYPKQKVIVREVGLRDGIQMAEMYPSTEQKKRWIKAEYDAGIRHFEVGSFLPASRFPQFADVREIIAYTHSLPGAVAIALVLNERGIEDALKADADELTVVMSATEEHNQANARRSREDSIKAIRHAVELRDRFNPNTVVNAGISMAFGCSIAGHVDPDEVARIAEACLEAGADTVGVADTVGYGGPAEVAAVCERMTLLLSGRPYVVHLHNTRGTGLANAAAALKAGATIFDASLGGLGGCPFAPGATGNVVIEDLVYLTEKMGFATGIDINQLVQARALIQESMPNEPVYGDIAKSGLPKNFTYSS
ncbi:hydroxymethylglutaryl-CoA lyase [Marinobacterium iners]|jgi:hydroxymethylglutaryl-CoA lyase|uniref:hydroxymethylglutaryl-CoA lyase n=1 Tax=Gammaproteobacteria TaxID=1236 RepID=UPI001A8F9A74|nr:hydroxymethylglutaryl-CoA lyase [Marinobacterium iners]QSR33835.1 hydroxymethylglutaryl-CoA lyase [Marinobacterium iners]